MDWLNPLFNDMEEFTSQIKDDFKIQILIGMNLFKKYGTISN